jgi:uncharacterized protein YifN (PemK superfamily)
MACKCARVIYRLRFADHGTETSMTNGRIQPRHCKKSLSLCIGKQANYSVATVMQLPTSISQQLATLCTGNQDIHTVRDEEEQHRVVARARLRRARGAAGVKHKTEESLRELMVSTFWLDT